MTVRHPIRLALAILFGVMLVGSLLTLLVPPTVASADDFGQTIQYHYSQVTNVSEEGLVTVGDYSFYADGYREGQWVHYQTQNGEVLRVANTYEELTNQF